MILIKLEIKNDILIINILAAALVATIYLFPENKIRIPLGLLFVLFLPGYVLIATLFPRKQDLDGIERFALSFGLSIAIVPLIGLALNFTPWGIRLYPILITLTGFVFLLSFITYFRRKKTPEEERFIITIEIETLKTEEYSKTDKILTIILILSILTAITALAYVIVTPKKGETFTEFYILGPNKKAEGYPTNTTTGETHKLIIGITNHEYETTRYDLKITLEEEQIYEKSLELSHNQTVEINYIFEPTQKGEDLKLEFLLYKNQNFTAPYRDLHLWINVE